LLPNLPASLKSRYQDCIVEGASHQGTNDIWCSLLEHRDTSPIGRGKRDPFNPSRLPVPRSRYPLGGKERRRAFGTWFYREWAEWEQGPTTLSSRQGNVFPRPRRYEGPRMLPDTASLGGFLTAPPPPICINPCGNFSLTSNAGWHPTLRIVKPQFLASHYY
jgi:hypothetical protein